MYALVRASLEMNVCKYCLGFGTLCLSALLELKCTQTYRRDVVAFHTLRPMNADGDNTIHSAGRLYRIDRR